MSRKVAPGNYESKNEESPPSPEKGRRRKKKKERRNKKKERSKKEARKKPHPPESPRSESDEDSFGSTVEFYVETAKRNRDVIKTANNIHEGKPAQIFFKYIDEKNKAEIKMINIGEEV